MNDMMEYKGYSGSLRYSEEDRVFFGKVEFIRSLVSFEGTDVDSLENAFHEAVDDYLNLCKSAGREAEKPYKGVFNVRTKPETHRRLVLLARRRNKNLNAIADDAFQLLLKREEGQDAR